jgi:hypothetical protein
MGLYRRHRHLDRAGGSVGRWRFRLARSSTGKHVTQVLRLYAVVAFRIARTVRGLGESARRTERRGWTEADRDMFI